MSLERSIVFGWTKKGLVAVVALLLTTIPTHAEVVPEVTFTAGYTDNLFNDSSSFDDSYAAISPSLKFYPSAATELSLAGTYTSYFDQRDLSNLAGRAGLTIIPDLKDSDLHLMFTGGVGGRSYGQLYDVYSSWGGNFSALFSYVARQGVIIRGGGMGSFREYTNSVSGDNEGVSCLIGINATLFGSNSFNAEASYGLRRYITDFEIVESGRGQNIAYRLDAIKESFQEANLSLRYSRPLGIRTGLSATYAHRFFVKDIDPVVYGFTIDNLSPWSSLWDGPSIGAKIKHFPGFDFIVESGFSFTDKEYIPNLDPDLADPDTTIETSTLNQRSDTRTNIFVSLQRPISTGTRRLFKPTLQFSWVNNASNMPLFEYAYFDIDFSLSIRF